MLTQQCLADCCRDIKENGRFVLVHITLSCDIQAVCVCVCVSLVFVCVSIVGALLDAVVQSSCTCPVCQQQSLEQPLKKRGGFHTTGPSEVAFLPKTTMTTLLSCSTKLLGSIDLAPGLCGLEIISRLSPFHTSLLDFLTSPGFRGSSFQDAF